ncbi:integrin alpha-6-like [Tachysurus vachellii]|uniref:integrin alpha-6-like n=1 Tax=Tachysurus vachellii TaxID=175792 RepID=UPI00296AFED3|nr:integrin alpha-6-like [Tachysurus vachellii]
MEVKRITLIVNLWLLINLNQQHGSAFNLDDTVVLRKNGEAGSLFGFSLAMHRELKPTNQQLLLIGAPRAKALPSQKANITGGLYRCKFTKQSDDCERIPVDTEDSRPGQGFDQRENQWMGVLVKSQGPGGKVVVCSHRYQQWIRDNRLVLGRCFILEQNLIVEDTRTFCRNRDSSKEQFGYCQQGVSAAFTRDKNYIVFSGPGAYEWKGTVRVEPVDNFMLDSYETGDQSEFSESRIPLTLSSYLGFALDSGMNLLKKDEQVIVAGAPRSNLSGEVLILKPEAVEAQVSLRVAHVLHGPGLASSFGYSLAVTDLDADGWDDLVVGAPQYSMTDIEAGIGGAVYVYINRRDGRDWDRLQPDILTGNKDSMFGLAVANTGDVNHDGYNDFAVGAPYDNDADGAVYIYFGKNGHFTQKDYQVLQGKAHRIKLFGYSLAGNMDIDGNGYPDLAVGSLSDSVLVYRAKPVISIEKSLTLTPSEMDFKKRDCQKGHCLITAESCFSYTTYPATYNPKLQILYKLNADERWVQERHQSRLVFQNNHEGNTVLQTQGQKQCVQSSLRLRANTENKLTEIPVSVSVSLPQYSPPQTLSQSSLPALQPALNDLQPRESTAKFVFLNPGCGSDNICQSNLQLQYSFCSKDQHQDSCSALAREDGVAVISPGAGNTALEVTVTNPGGDDAHLAQLVANFPESLPLSSVILNPDSKVNVQCDVDASKTRVECNLGNPFKRNAEVTFYLLLNSDRLTPSVTDVNVTLNLQTISVQNISEIVAEARVFFELYLQVFGLAKPSQVYYREMKNNKSDEVIGEPVQYEFTISNMGRPLKSFASATLNIQWPKENKAGKRLLYLLRITGPNNQSIRCSPDSEISPLRQAQEVISRGKRQAENEAKASAFSTEGLLSLFGSKRHYKYLTCDDELKCVDIRCPLKASDRTAVTLHSRLWSRTFVKEYSSLNYLDIVLNVSLSLDGSQKNIRLRESQTQVRLTVFPEKKPTFLSRVPWWVGLLSVVLALLLLSLLIYFLSKLGCFDCALCTEDKEYQPMNVNHTTK